MDTARADILAARDHLRKQGWIAPRNESFRHLPPPGLENWLQGPTDGTESGCDAPPLAGAGWTMAFKNGLLKVGGGRGKVCA